VKACVLLTTVVLGIAAVTLSAAAFSIKTTNDSGPGSLRAALASAADGDTIDASSVTGTITLTSGELFVTNSVTIIGAGPAKLSVNGNFPNTTNRVIHVASNTLVSVSSLTVTNGRPNGGSGGGILNDRSTLTISNCTISGNFGGGIRNKSGPGSATLIVVNCAISGNSTDKSFGSGAGIGNDGNSGNATLIILNSLISGNSQSAGDGGGIANAGGFPGTGAVTIVNSTLSGNSASYYGGGIVSAPGSGRATLVVSNCTFTGGSVMYGGGGIFVPLASGSGSSALSIGNTILKSSAGNLLVYSGTVTSFGYNLCSDSGGGWLHATGDIINTDPKLGPLQDNGGPTFTHALLPGSPAIDAGDPAFAPPPEFDQRGTGFPRVVNGRIDIGAFEFTPELLITAADRIDNDLRLTFSGALLGKSYEIQSCTDTTLTGWQSIPGSTCGNGGVANMTVSNAFNQTQQLYRIRQLP
jgi:hypothetical protein